MYASAMEAVDSISHHDKDILQFGGNSCRDSTFEDAMNKSTSSESLVITLLESDSE